MKQNQAKWISFVLYALVFLSLYLSWRILIVPSSIVSVQRVDPSSQGTSVPSTNVKSLEDLFAPYQLAVHSNMNTYVTQEPTVMSDVNKFMMEWKMQELQFERLYPESAYRELLLETGRVEVKFPAAIHFALLTQYFDFMPEELMDRQINRILISTDLSQPIYLVNDADRNVYIASRPEQSMQPLISLYTENQEAFRVADAYAFQEGISFLPRDPVELSSYSYLIEKQPNSFFINQLFEDTTELRDDSNEFVTAYSDNISELRINKDTGLLYYYRNNLDPTNIPAYQQVKDSFHSLKFIDTWTQNSYFVGYNSDISEITYRRFLKGLPVFNVQERGIVRMEMGNSYPIRIQYPTEVIQTPLEDREAVIELPRTQEVINMLTENGFAFSEIEMLQLGYEWRSSEESTRITEMTPRWFVKIDGTWKTVESWLTVMEESQYGL